MHLEKVSLVAEISKDGKMWEFTVLFFESEREEVVCFVDVGKARFAGEFQTPESVPVGSLSVGISQFEAECRRHLQIFLLESIRKREKILEALRSTNVKQEHKKIFVSLERKQERKIRELKFCAREGLFLRSLRKFETQEGKLFWEIGQ